MCARAGGRLCFAPPLVHTYIHQPTHDIHTYIHDIHTYIHTCIHQRESARDSDRERKRERERARRSERELVLYDLYDTAGDWSAGLEGRRCAEAVAEAGCNRARSLSLSLCHSLSFYLSIFLSLSLSLSLRGGLHSRGGGGRGGLQPRQVSILHLSPDQPSTLNSDP